MASRTYSQTRWRFCKSPVAWLTACPCSHDEHGAIMMMMWERHLLPSMSIAAGCMQSGPFAGGMALPNHNEFQIPRRQTNTIGTQERSSLLPRQIKVAPIEVEDDQSLCCTPECDTLLLHSHRLSATRSVSEDRRRLSQRSAKLHLSNHIWSRLVLALATRGL